MKTNLIRNKIGFVIVLGLFVFITVGMVCLADSTSLETKKEQVNTLFAQWNKPGTPGAAVVVVQKGKTVFKNFYGFANLEHGIPISENTVFAVGSVSKQFTGFAILQLEKQGKLSLQDDIRIYIPELPDLGETVTISHLLHHTGGLKEQFHLLAMAGVFNADTITMDQILKLVINQKHLAFKPGERLMYSNTGYMLLATIVQRITGKSFRRYMDEIVFQPLGMTHSHFHDDLTEIIKNKADSYDVDETTAPGFARGLLNHGIVGNTGLFTTASDMAKWLNNWIDHKIGGPDLLEKMTRTDLLNSGEKTDYGFGIGVTAYRGLKVLLHSGSDSGYRAYTAIFPDQSFGLAVFTNLYAINPSALGKKIQDIFLSEYFTSPEEKPKTEEIAGETQKNITLTREQLAEYTGTFYSEELGTVYKIERLVKILALTHIRNETVLLKPSADKDVFTCDTWWLKEVAFTRDKNGKISGCRLSSSRAPNVIFTKITK